MSWVYNITTTSEWTYSATTTNDWLHLMTTSNDWTYLVAEVLSSDSEGLRTVAGGFIITKAGNKILVK